MARRLSEDHWKRQIAERALLKLADGGKQSRHDLFNDRRIPWNGKNGPPSWQKRLLLHVLKQGWVARTGDNTGVRYEVCAGKQQALRQLRADAQALCGVLFAEGAPEPLGLHQQTKITDEMIGRARELFQDHNQLQTCEALESEFGVRVSATGLRRAMSRAASDAPSPPPGDESSLEEPVSGGSNGAASLEELSLNGKVDTLLRVVGAMAQALIGMQQRLGAMETKLDGLAGPVNEAADVLRQLK